MGPFNIFKNKNSSKTNPFKDLFDLDLSSLLSKSKFYKKHVNDEGDFNSMEYECFLDDPVFEIFDNLRIRLGWEEKEIRIDPSHSIILTFISRNLPITTQNCAFIVNTLAKACKIYNENWEDIDEMDINQGLWRGRSFFISGGPMVSIELDENKKLSVCIVGYEAFLE